MAFPLLSSFNHRMVFWLLRVSSEVLMCVDWPFCSKKCCSIWSPLKLFLHACNGIPCNLGVLCFRDEEHQLIAQYCQRYPLFLLFIQTYRWSELSTSSIAALVSSVFCVWMNFWLPRTLPLTYRGGGHTLPLTYRGGGAGTHYHSLTGVCLLLAAAIIIVVFFLSLQPEERYNGSGKLLSECIACHLWVLSDAKSDLFYQQHKSLFLAEWVILSLFYSPKAQPRLWWHWMR